MAILKDTSALCLGALMIMAAVLSPCDAEGGGEGCSPLADCELYLCRKNCGDNLRAYCTFKRSIRYCCCAARPCYPSRFIPDCTDERCRQACGGRNPGAHCTDDSNCCCPFATPAGR